MSFLTDEEIHERLKNGMDVNALLTDDEQVPRGKGEKNPGEGSSKTLKSHAYKQFEGYAGAIRNA